MKLWLRNHWPFLLIFLLGLGLRLRLLTIRGTFWFDEMFSVHFSQLPWKEAARYAIIETNPPLYTLFLRFWLKIVPETEILARLPSLLFGLATMILIYWFACQTLNRRTAIVSTLFFAIADLHLFLNTEARVYSLLTFLALASFICYYYLFVANKKQNWLWGLYLFLNFLLIFSHLTALAIPLAQFLGLFLLKQDKKTVHHWFGAHAGLALVWLIWFIPSIIAKADYRSLTAWYFDASNYNNANWLSIFTALFFTNYYPLVFTFVSLGILSAFGFLLIRAKNKQIPEKNIPWLIVMALWAGLLVFAGSLCGVLTAKYYITSSLAIYLLIGYAISLLKLNRTGFILLIFFLFLILFPSGLTVANRAVFSWKDAVNYIEKNETDTSLTFVIPFNETLPLSRYYHGRRPLLGVYPYQDNLTFEERVVRFNWNKQVSDKKFLEKWLTEHTTEADKLFYIQYTDTYDWTHQILLSQGWKVKNSFRPRGFVNIYVFEFVRADK